MIESVTAAPLDCVIVGGGPAGLTAAIYLARFHLSVLVVDAGASRAASIPCTRNHAGFPDGISGADLLGRMRRQAVLYGAGIVTDELVALDVTSSLFTLSMASGSLQSRSVLLATGVVNRRPAMADALHTEALARGLLRYCPICDGYEVTDTRVAVLGSGEHGTSEALFLRGYTADITLIAPDGPHVLDADQRDQLSAAGVVLRDGPCDGFALDDDRIALTLPAGVEHYASLYPALGSHIRSTLAATVGAAISDEGCLLVDAHQRTDIPGLYAAGDVVLGLDQISHAMGQGGVAATAIRNDLDQRCPLRR